MAKDEGRPYDQAAFVQRVQSAVAEVVQQQHASGIDIINDGEESKRSFSTYVRERFNGWEERPPQPDEQPSLISGRDMLEFPEYFASRGGFGGSSANARQIFCTGPLTYIGHAAVQVALLNNRGLQAVYAELGIAEADLVQAGRMRNPGFKFERLQRGVESLGLHTGAQIWLIIKTYYCRLLWPS